MALPPVTGLIVASSPIVRAGASEPCRLLQLAADEEHYTVVLVEHATEELAAAIGLSISIHQYVAHDGGWIGCHQSGVLPSAPMDDGVQVTGAGWHRFPGPPFNYRGRCTGIVEAGLRYELDGHLQLLYDGLLSVGEQYLLHNLRTDEGALAKGLLTACPLYTTVSRGGCSPLFHRQWSIHDLFLWRSRTGEMQRVLEGLLSSSHLRSVEGYTELGSRICRALRGGVLDPVVEFRRHCQEGRCHYCADPVLPQNILTRDEACQSGSCVSLLGLLSVCEVTGRPLLRAGGSIELNLLLAPESQSRHPWQFDHLVICIDATVYRDDGLSFAILAQPPVYVAPIIAKDSREGEGEREQTASSPLLDLVLIKSLSSTPILLSKTGGMVVSVEGYKFGRLCLHRGKLEMIRQTAIRLTIRAAAASRKALAPGVVIVLEAQALSTEECRVVQYEAGDENLAAKEIRLLSMDKHMIRLSCSSVAAAYLQGSKDLLTGRLDASSGAPSLVALVMDKEYVAATLLGLSQPVRSKLPYHIRGEKYLVVNLQCAFTRQRLCLPPGFLYPLGLVAGAKLSIYHCKQVKDLQGGPLLLPTSRTAIMFAGMRQRERPSGKDIGGGGLEEYPIKFIHELSDSDYATINGRFLRLLTFEAQARCPSCHSGLRAAKCLSHGIIAQSACELVLQALFCFTDGLEEANVVISDASLLDRAGLITMDRLGEMVMRSEISVDYRLGSASEAASAFHGLLEPLRSLTFLMQDYHLVVLTLPASGLVRLQALAIRPIDYFDQCRRLLAINREAPLVSPKEAYKPVSG